MNSIKTYIGSLGRATRVLILAIAVVIAGAGVTQAATTISTNISTAGTLSVTGLATLLGGATTTQITLLAGDTIKNASASSTVISGALNTTGALSSSVGVSGTTGTFSSTLSVTSLATFLGGASTTQFTLLSGDTIKNASASSTVISGALQTTGGFTGTSGAFSTTLAVTGATTLSASTTVGTATLFVGDDMNRVGVGTTTPLDIFMVENQSATTTVVVSTGAAAKGGRIILEDVTGTACTEVTAAAGVLTAKVVTCPTGI